ncbi:MAG: DegT/DnrJ/EryC1/StrS family aminotransferase [Acidobacteria bacterium]|nr:MAG: DegT/DnrJ/EryC1/StrS family aminotransferase [Acidobacteriota bacterium]
MAHATESAGQVNVGRESAGGITSSYTVDEGVRLRVPYSFFGSIYDGEEEAAVLSAMKQDSLTMGPQVLAFQKSFAEYTGTKYAFAVSNCTTAMHVCSQVIGLRPGDEVIVTPNTFIATTLVILKEGATPVYADIDRRTFNIDPREVEKKVTNRTKAIYVVHYGGQMVDMDPIMEIAARFKLVVMEDCAHAPGAEYKGRKAGSIGDFGCFSFHSLKNMTTLGEGGMISCNIDRYAEGIEKLRCMNLDQWKDQKDYWIPSHFDVVDFDGKWGNNYRMNEAQAAVGSVQLKKLDWLNSLRVNNGRYVTEGIKGIRGITPVYEDPDCKHVYHLYTVCIEEQELGASRDDFLRVLYREEGIQGILHYQPTYHFTGLKKLGYRQDLCPNAEEFFYRRDLNTPQHPRLTRDQLDAIIQGVRSAAAKVRR